MTRSELLFEPVADTVGTQRTGYVIQRPARVRHLMEYGLHATAKICSAAIPSLGSTQIATAAHTARAAGRLIITTELDPLMARPAAAAPPLHALLEPDRHVREIINQQA